VIFSSRFARVVSLALGSSFLVLLLNSLSGLVLFLAFDFLLSELVPQFVELSSVLLSVVRVVNDGEVLLVVGSSSIGPIERTSHNERLIHNHELVVHVVSRGVISANRDTCVSHSLDV